MPSKTPAEWPPELAALVDFNRRRVRRDAIIVENWMSIIEWPDGYFPAERAACDALRDALAAPPVPEPAEARAYLAGHPAQERS
jgi:hypothetical protein